MLSSVVCAGFQTDFLSCSSRVRKRAGKEAHRGLFQIPLLPGLSLSALFFFLVSFATRESCFLPARASPGCRDLAGGRRGRFGNGFVFSSRRGPAHLRERLCQTRESKEAAFEDAGIRVPRRLALWRGHSCDAAASLLSRTGTAPRASGLLGSCLA